jgi:hypothetical protein
MQIYVRQFAVQATAKYNVSYVLGHLQFPKPKKIVRYRYGISYALTSLHNIEA